MTTLRTRLTSLLNLTAILGQPDETELKDGLNGIIGDLDDAETITKLTKDLKVAVTTMTPKEARFLVDSYYQMQRNRLRSAGQIRSVSAGAEPHDCLDWLEDNGTKLENQIKAALDAWSNSKPMGVWARTVKGIGPVLSAGLLAHIDIEQAPTAGHIWRFAGLDPTSRWNKKEKRPWNAKLKVICWKIGESFVKVSGQDDAFYGKIYLQRKALEIGNNDSGKLAGQAQASAEVYAETADAWLWYSGSLPPGATRAIAEFQDEKARKQWLKENKLEPGTGQPMLCPAHLHARAKRYAVKLFLSHWHGEAYRQHFKKEPPLPYPVAFLGHTHFIQPPN
jgi:hypothetical protein